MHTMVQTSETSNAVLWTGRIMSGLVIAFMLLDGAMKLVPLDVVVTTSEQMGIPGSLARTLGIIGLICTLLYAVPRTSVLGAILLTGYWAERSQAICGSAMRSSHTHCSGSISACWPGAGSICATPGCAPLSRYAWPSRNRNQTCNAN
jgi:hypothetical protein